MKKLIVLLMTGALMATVTQAELWTENFDSYTEIQILDAGEGFVVLDAHVKASASLGYGGSGMGAGRMASGSYDQGYIYKEISGLNMDIGTGEYEITYRIFSHEITGGDTLSFNRTYIGDGDDSYIYVYLYKGELVTQRFLSGTSTSIATTHLTDGVWYDIKLTIDMDYSTYGGFDIFYRASAAGDTGAWTTLTSVMYQMGTTAANQIDLDRFTFGGRSGKAGIDDIRIISVPEPATMVLLALGLLLTIRRKRA